MKTADEVAEGMLSKFNGMTFYGGLGNAWLRTEIIKALQAFAKERVKEALTKVLTITPDAAAEMDLENRREIRAEALEEAANVAQSYLMIGHQMNPQFPQIAKNVAEQIRALKNKP